MQQVGVLATMGYRRMVIDALDQLTADATWRSLAALMHVTGNLTEENRLFMADHTLIRKLESQYLDTEQVPLNRKITLQSTHGSLQFNIALGDLPQHLPNGWSIDMLDEKIVRVTLESSCEIYVRDYQRLRPVRPASCPQASIWQHYIQARVIPVRYR